MPYYKAVRLDHTSHYDHKTRWHEGAIVTPRGMPSPPEEGSCGIGIHCSPTILGALRYQDGQSDYCEVQPLGVIAADDDKARCSAVQVLRWIPPEEQDALSGFSLYEANHPVNPLLLERNTSLPLETLLEQWASVWDSVRDRLRPGARPGVRDSVLDSVRDSVRDTMWPGVWPIWVGVFDGAGGAIETIVEEVVEAILEDHGEASARVVLEDRVWESVWDSVAAYIGGLFPSIASWKYAEHLGPDPWRPLLTLWYGGYVPSCYGSVWRLHAGPRADVVYSKEA